MKVLAGAYQTHLDTGTTTLAYALRITRTDAQVYGFTSASASVEISGVTYDAAQGLDISSITTSAGLSVDNLELSTVDDGTLFTRADVLGGRWQGAAFLIFRYSWGDAGLGTEPMLAGTIGEVRLLRGQVVAELRGLQQYLQQPLGSVSSKTCRARFADWPQAAPGNACGLNVAAYTDVGEVTAVTSQRVIETDLAEADDYYAEGVLTWTSGGNDGLRAKVKTYVQASGVVTLLTPMVAEIQVGDTFDVVAGCRKRLEDCRDKFANVLNFQGEPHRPTLDGLTAPPEGTS